MNLKQITSKCLLRYPTFLDLFSGKWMTHYNSQSEADLALIRMIKECEGDRKDAAKIMGKSALGVREKWRARRDYRKMTLDKIYDQPTDLNQENDK